MAAEIDHHHHHLHDHQAFFENTSRSCPELSFDSQQIEYESESSVSISDIIDQGSVSFGKYATEALAWEKRSVFLHDRFQEELEKFKNPGLVAQKKAYFEEYYKKLRAMKALQAEQQKIAQLEACQNAQNSTPQIEKNVNSTVLNDENNVSQIPIADNNTVGILHSSSGGTVYDSEQVTEVQSGKKNLSTVKAKHSTKGTSLSQTSPSVSMKIALKKSPANQPKKQVPGLQAKGIVASVRNKTMLESSRTTKSASKESEKPKPTLRKVIQKSGNIPRSKKIDPKAASKIKKQITKVFPTPIVPNSLLAKDKQVSSFSSVKASLMKPSTTSQGLAVKLTTRLPVNDQATKPVSSSSSIRTRQLKPSTTSECLAGMLPSRSSFQVQCAKPLSSTSSRIRTPQKPSTTSEGFSGKLPTRLSVQVQCANPVSSTSSIRTTLEKPSTSSEELAGKLPTRSTVQVKYAKPVSPISSIRTPLGKPSTSSEGLAGKLPSRSSVHVPCAKPVSSSSSIRTRLVKPSTTPQGLVKKLPTKLPVNSESSKSISKDKASTGGLRNLVKRSANPFSPRKSSLNGGAEHGQRRLVQEGKKIKEGKEKVVAVAEVRRDPRAASSPGPRRDPKPASSTVSNISRTLRRNASP